MAGSSECCTSLTCLASAAATCPGGRKAPFHHQKPLPLAAVDDPFAPVDPWIRAGFCGMLWRSPVLGGSEVLMGRRVGAKGFMNACSASAAGTAVEGRPAAAGAAAGAAAAGQPHLARVALACGCLPGWLSELPVPALLLVEDACAHGVKKPRCWSLGLLRKRRRQHQTTRPRMQAATMPPTTPAQHQALIGN